MELKIRGTYLLQSRNLRVGVWDGRGFIGIREKFGHRFLFIEYPNTATAIEDLEMEPEPQIMLRTDYELSYCYWCGWPCDFDEARKPRWQHLVDADHEPRPTGRTYAPLFQYLDELDHPNGAAFR